MPIPVTCECGQTFQTRDENAGRRARCPDCGREFTVPEPEVFRIDDLDSWVSPPATMSDKAIASLFLGFIVCGTALTGIPAIILGFFALREIDRSQGRIKGKALAIAGIVLGVLSTLLMFIPVGHPGEPSRRAQCVNNLKQIALAMQNYHEVYGCFPPAAITDRQGRPLLSWRVAILPFLEGSPTYSKFHLDEPWNSPHNLSLLDQVPSFYRCPSDTKLQPGKTNYRVIVDPRSVFRPDFQPVKFTDILDGVSNTILVGESQRAVPWTAPDDLHLDPASLQTGFGSHHSGGFNAAFADGSVHFLKTGMPPATLKALIRRDDSRDSVEPHSF